MERSFGWLTRFRRLTRDLPGVECGGRERGVCVFVAVDAGEVGEVTFSTYPNSL